MLLLTRKLLDARSNPRAKDNNDWTPLHWLCYCQDIASSKERQKTSFEMSKLLLDRDPTAVEDTTKDFRGQPLLHWAAKSARPDLVR